MGALHQVNAQYYGDPTGAEFDAAGHPGDKWGFAVGGGIKLNAPMIGQGDYFSAEVNYAQGASGYVFSPQIAAFNWYGRHGDNAGYGMLSDAVYGGAVDAGNTTSLQLTTSWGVNGGFEHHWNPQWKTSVYGGYAEVDYNAQANAILCSLQGDGAGVGSTAVANAGCNNNWSTWYLGTRTQWNITKDFYMGVDVMYSSLQSATTSTASCRRSTSCAARPLSATRMRSRWSSASTRTSIPDRVISEFDDKGPRRETAGGFFGVPSLID